MKVKAGQRVTVILSADTFQVKSLGGGVLDGTFRPPKELHYGNPDCDVPDCMFCLNPRITLDTGKQVWGFQVWFTSEAEFKETMAQRYPHAEVVLVDDPFNNPLQTQDDSDPNVITDVVPKGVTLQ